METDLETLFPEPRELARAARLAFDLFGDASHNLDETGQANGCAYGDCARAGAVADSQNEGTSGTAGRRMIAYRPLIQRAYFWCARCQRLEYRTIPRRRRQIYQHGV